MKLKTLVNNILILGAVLASLVFLLLFNLGEEKSRVLDAIFNFGHLPLFGVVALVLLWILNKKKWPVTNYRLYLASFTVTLILGITTEFLQRLTPDRYFEISDMLYDTIGAFTFLTLAYPSLGYIGSKVSAYKKVSILVIIAAALPVYLSVFDTWRMNRDVPLLGSFETRLEMERWSAKTAPSADR